MAAMATATGDHALATTMLAQADKVQKAATKILWNEQLGVFMASTGLERENVDIWGNAMAGAMGFTTPAQDAKMFAYFKANEDKIFYEGQVHEIRWHPRTQQPRCVPTRTDRSREDFGPPRTTTFCRGSASTTNRWHVDCST